MKQLLVSIALLWACTEPSQPSTHLPAQSFVATLHTVDTVEGPPFLTVDQTCSGHRTVSEILYDRLTFGLDARVQGRSAIRHGSSYAPDTVVTWGDPVQLIRTGDYEQDASTVSADWDCPTCGLHDNLQPFQRVDSTELVYPFGAIGAGCLVNGQIVNSTAREVPFRYAVTYLPPEGVRPN